MPSTEKLGLESVPLNEEMTCRKVILICIYSNSWVLNCIENNLLLIETIIIAQVS